MKLSVCWYLFRSGNPLGCGIQSNLQAKGGKLLKRRLQNAKSAEMHFRVVFRPDRIAVAHEESVVAHHQLCLVEPTEVRIFRAVLVVDGCMNAWTHACMHRSERVESSSSTRSNVRGRANVGKGV